MEYFLKQIAPDNSEHKPITIRLVQDQQEIGRKSFPCLSRYSKLSNRHALLKKINNDWFVKDLDSLNGVYVNGTKIREIKKLCNGDVIGFGHGLKILKGFVCTICLTFPEKQKIVEVSSNNEPVENRIGKDNITDETSNNIDSQNHSALESVNKFPQIKLVSIPLVKCDSKYFHYPSGNKLSFQCTKTIHKRITEFSDEETDIYKSQKVINEESSDDVGTRKTENKKNYKHRRICIESSDDETDFRKTEKKKNDKKRICIESSDEETADQETDLRKTKKKKNDKQRRMYILSSDEDTDTHKTKKKTNDKQRIICMESSNEETENEGNFKQNKYSAGLESETQTNKISLNQSRNTLNNNIHLCSSFSAKNHESWTGPFSALENIDKVPQIKLFSIPLVKFDSKYFHFPSDVKLSSQLKKEIHKRRNGIIESSDEESDIQKIKKTYIGSSDEETDIQTKKKKNYKQRRLSIESSEEETDTRKTEKKNKYNQRQICIESSDEETDVHKIIYVESSDTETDTQKSEKKNKCRQICIESSDEETVTRKTERKNKYKQKQICIESSDEETKVHKIIYVESSDKETDTKKKEKKKIYKRRMCIESADENVNTQNKAFPLSFKKARSDLEGNKRKMAKKKTRSKRKQKRMCRKRKMSGNEFVKITPIKSPKKQISNFFKKFFTH